MLSDIIRRLPIQRRKPTLLSKCFSSLLSCNINPNVIIDVGANKGRWTAQALNFFPSADYYLFEPQLSLVQGLHKRFKSTTNITIVDKGCSSCNQTLSFTYHERNDSCNFSTSSADAAAFGYRQEELDVISLDSFFQDYDLGMVILKIDAEGHDIDVLKGCTSILPSVDLIFIECGVTCNHIENSFDAIYKYMSQLGFTLFDFTDLNRQQSPPYGLWLVEAVFKRKSSSFY